MKCNKKCDALRIEAKELGGNSKNLEALEKLNEALCHASNDDKKSLIYADRAAICFELKVYEKCLENIRLAKNCGLENCSINALNENCINALKNEKPRDRDDEENSEFFSITSAKNKRIPFIADCLKLQESWKFGRGIFTNRLIKTGEVLVVEKPFFKILNKDVRYRRCANCLRKNTATLIACDKYCISSLYCNENCKNEAWKNYHSEECKTLEVHLEHNEYDLMIKKILFESLALFDGNLAKMKSFLSDTKNQTAYDFDFSEGSDNEKNKKYLKSIFALRGAINSEEDKEMSEWLIQNDPSLKSFTAKREHVDFIKSFMLRIMGILDRNSYIFYDLKSNPCDEEIGSGIFAYASLFNHSCSPNLFRFFKDGQQVYIVKKPIEKNQQLFVGYMPNFTQCSRDERQANLLQDFFFKCTCEACASNNNYPLMKDLIKYDVNFCDPPTTFESIFEAKEQYKRNCEYIEEVFKKYPFPNFNICKTIHNSFYLLQYIANNNGL